MTVCFLFKVMPRTPVGIKPQGPIVVMWHSSQKAKLPASKVFLHSGIKTIFVTDVNLRAIISILTKKEGHFLWDWVCPILFFKAIVILTLRMSADVVLAWLEHCRGSESWGKGVPRYHTSRWHQESPSPTPPPQLTAAFQPKLRGKQLLVLGKELASKPKESTQQVSHHWAETGGFQTTLIVSFWLYCPALLKRAFYNSVVTQSVPSASRSGFHPRYSSSVHHLNVLTSTHHHRQGTCAEKDIPERRADSWCWQTL